MEKKNLCANTNRNRQIEYLISYCLKNYYIKNANRIADGNYVPKWKYDNKEVAPEMPDELTVILNGHRYNLL